ncbi:hypothetical protein [Candidatus Odyssella acanthamoebae]|uniref:Uncharacterized protein n=1 Tax=Candidatus Odyssella acanthamoebae TaxID=91604 RepID=A0A077AVE0_9PROT|nr:hypothetical protein [Candidatus Paracaedibacter acanthamoebae]AIK96004.1 hypothetical protein ID47_03490 [Candidatus Paracaedibacter acanthamoebae]
MKNHNINSWLQHKRLALIGSDSFIPKDYGHLLWHWGVIDDKMRSFLKRYGRLRGLVLVSQGRVVTWTHGRHLYPGRSFRLPKEESMKIEGQWRKMVATLKLKDISLLDWLTQEPIDYNTTRQDIVKRFKSMSQSH